MTSDQLSMYNYQLKMNEKENLIQVKSYAFALKIIKLYKALVENRKEWVLSKQLLRSGTSIGANIEEAIGAQSKKDFISKVNIAYKEARETIYWVKLLRDSSYISKELSEMLLKDCEELCKIMGKILSTSKKNSIRN